MKLFVHIHPLAAPIVDATFGSVRPRQTRAFVLPVVDPTMTFRDIWQHAEARFTSNYPEGKRNDWQFTKITIGDSFHYDVDLRDKVADLFGHTSDGYVHIHQAPFDREISIPIDSNLRFINPKKRHLILNNPDAKRKKLERERYGTPLENLHPDNPVPSAEKDHPSLDSSRTPHKVDTDGFKIPKPLPKRIHDALQAVRNAHARDLKAARDVSCIEDSEDERAAIPKQLKLDKVSARDLAATRDASRIPDSEDERAATPKQPESDNISARDSSIAKTEEEVQAHTQDAAEESTRGGHEDSALAMNETSSHDLFVPDIAPSTAPSRAILPVGSKILKRAQKFPADLLGQFSQASQEAPQESWDQTEINNFRHAVRLNLGAANIKQRWFQSRSMESIMKKLAQVRHEMEEETRREKALEYKQERIRIEDQTGNISTTSNQRWTQSEDDLLLAARLEGLDIHRLAKKRFPRREPTEVVRRCKNVFKAASRDAERANPNKQFHNGMLIHALPEDRKLRIQAKLDAMPEDVADFAEQMRAEELADKRAKQAKLDLLDKQNQHRLRREASYASARRTEQERAKESAFALQRALEDNKNKSQYWGDIAAWQEEAEAARDAGMPVPPEPRMPPASTIGEIVISSQASQAQTSNTATKKVVPRIHAAKSEGFPTQDPPREHRKAVSDATNSISPTDVITSHQPVSSKRTDRSADLPVAPATQASNSQHLPIGGSKVKSQVNVVPESKPGRAKTVAVQPQTVQNTATTQKSGNARSEPRSSRPATAPPKASLQQTKSSSKRPRDASSAAPPKSTKKQKMQPLALITQAEPSRGLPDGRVAELSKSVATTSDPPSMVPRGTAKASGTKGTGRRSQAPLEKRPATIDLTTRETRSPSLSEVFPPRNSPPSKMRKLTLAPASTNSKAVISCSFASRRGEVVVPDGTAPKENVLAAAIKRAEVASRPTMPTPAKSSPQETPAVQVAWPRHQRSESSEAAFQTQHTLPKPAKTYSRNKSRKSNPKDTPRKQSSVQTTLQFPREKGKQKVNSQETPTKIKSYSRLGAAPEESPYHDSIDEDGLTAVTIAAERSSQTMRSSNGEGSSRTKGRAKKQDHGMCTSSDEAANQLQREWREATGAAEIRPIVIKDDRDPIVIEESDNDEFAALRFRPGETPEARMKRLRNAEAEARKIHDERGRREWAEIERRRDAADKKRIEAICPKVVRKSVKYTIINSDEDSADEELDRAYEEDDLVHHSTEPETSNEAVTRFKAKTPGSSPPEMPAQLPKYKRRAIAGLTSQDSIDTAELRPDFPSSGKVRSLSSQGTVASTPAKGKLPTHGLRGELKGKFPASARKL